MEDQIKSSKSVPNKQPKLDRDLIDWEKILDEIDFLSLKVLDYIYLKDKLTLHGLAEKLTEFGICSTTVKNRLTKLEEWGLIELVCGSNPLCVVKKLRLEDKIKQLIVLGYGKFEVNRVE